MPKGEGGDVKDGRGLRDRTSIALGHVHSGEGRKQCWQMGKPPLKLASRPVSTSKTMEMPLKTTKIR